MSVPRDRLPEWTPLLVAGLAVLLIPVLFAVPRPGIGATYEAWDSILEALPFLVAGLGLVLGLVSDPGRVRNIGLAASAVVLLAPLWWGGALLVMGDVGCDRELGVTYFGDANESNPPPALNVTRTQAEVPVLAETLDRALAEDRHYVSLPDPCKHRDPVVAYLQQELGKRNDGFQWRDGAFRLTDAKEGAL